MVLKLHKLNSSPPARATMMACELFKVPVEMVDCSIPKGEHLSADFLKKNPTHTIPVLEDGDLILHDSHAILMYLAEVYDTDGSWYPKDIKQRALVNQKLFFNSSILFPRLRDSTYPLVAEGVKTITEKQLNAIDEAYGFLEEFLSRTKYVAGNTMTIADIAAYATTSSLVLLLELNAQKSKFCNLLKKTIPRERSRGQKLVGNIMVKTKLKLNTNLGLEAFMSFMHEALNSLDIGIPKIFLSFQMVLKLHKLDGSPPARATMMACELFKVPVELVDCNILKGEHLSADFLKKNPTHSVPVLEDGDLILHDSHAILMYLAEVYDTDGSWYPKDIKQRALVNQKLFFNSSILFPRLRNITYPLLVEGVKTITEKQLNSIDEAYGFLEEFLSRTKYVAGNTMTIADIAAYATTSSLVLLLELNAQKYPKIQAWHTTMKQLSFVKNQNSEGVIKLKEMIDNGLAE